MTHAAHHSDDEAVDRFAAELKAKLADARAKGRGGWEDKVQVSAKDLSEMLLAHVFKGDPRDVANFAMFLHQRGESIALSEHPAQQQEPVTFLANGTRFKLSFFENEADGCGNASTYVTCFEAFKKELDGRWVALVSAEDDCHRKGGHSMKRLYLSGPMSGLPELNFPAFHAEAARLRALGFEVVNPADLNPDPGKGWKDCLRVDLLELLGCDAIAMLPGWKKSEGAHLEMHVAHRVGIDILDATDIQAPADAVALAA